MHKKVVGIILNKKTTMFDEVFGLAHNAHASSMSSSAARMYNTLLQRTRTSPRLPVQEPSMYSSVLASCKFMYPSDETRKPLYSWPHFSLTMTALPVSPLRKGLGFMGMEAILNLARLSLVEVNQAIKAW